MIQRFIHSIRLSGPFDALDESFVKTAKGRFPPLVSRRMTRLALLCGEVTHDANIRQDDSVVYATTYAETLCLESYLASFPTPSPLGFQNSIHPSGLEQVLIARQQPVDRFLCFAGKEALISSALMAVCASEQQRQWLVVAEEKGTWLTERGHASDCFFSCCLGFAPEQEGAMGTLCWDPSQTGAEAPALSAPAWMQLLLERRRFCCASPCGTLSIEWN
jgi:hypothetical protein